MRHVARSTIHRRSLGFSLMNAMLLIMLVSIIVAVAGQLFNSGAIITRQLHAAEVSIRQWRQITNQMRSDVWRATRIERIDPLTIELTQPDDSVIRWQRREGAGVSEKENTLTRTYFPSPPGDDNGTSNGQKKRVWKDHDWNGTFSTDGTALIVDIPQFAYVPQSSLYMISQYQVVNSAMSDGDEEPSP